MPAPKMRLPRYFSLSTATPRMTAISVVRSSVATSTASSVWAKGRVVLGVEETRIDHVEMDGLAASREARGAEIERAACGEFRDERGAFRPRQQHRVTEMLADARARKHMGEEQALVDLDAVLVALPMSGFGVDLLLVSGPIPERASPRRRRGRRGAGTSSRARSGDRRSARHERRETIRETRARPTTARPRPPVRLRSAAASAAASQGEPPSGARRRRSRERRPRTRQS